MLRTGEPHPRVNTSGVVCISDCIWICISDWICIFDYICISYCIRCNRWRNSPDTQAPCTRQHIQCALCIVQAGLFVYLVFFVFGATCGGMFFAQFLCTIFEARCLSVCFSAISELYIYVTTQVTILLGESGSVEEFAHTKLERLLARAQQLRLEP